MEIGTAESERETLLKEKNEKVVVVRSENPAITPLAREPARLQRFAQITNEIIQENKGTFVETPWVEIAERFGRQTPFRVVEIPYQENEPKKETGLKLLLKSLFQNSRIREGLFFELPPEEERRLPLLAHRNLSPKLYYFMAPTIGKAREGRNPYQEEGLFLKGKKEIPLLGSWKVQAEKLLSRKPQQGTLEIHDFGSLSEVELAYETIIASLIMAGKLDLSSQEKMRENLPFRRKIFLQVYKEMLKEMAPEVKKEEVFGLENQMTDIETNLVAPLTQREGKPMNTLLVGAPGVGKSFVGRYFAHTAECLILPLSVEKIKGKTLQGERVFENLILPRLVKIQNSLRLPVILLIDDIEAILESGITIGPTGEKSEAVDVEERSLTLNLLERLQDTYGIFLLCTLNHPDVEAAFLRRFNPIYFPLPSPNQREYMLRRIIEKGPLSDKDHQELLSELKRRTDGFNHSGLALIPEYQRNILLAYQKGEKDSESYRESFLKALQKAKERTNLKGLSRFDRAAREMTGQRTNEEIGFLRRE